MLKEERLGDSVVGNVAILGKDLRHAIPVQEKNIEVTFKKIGLKNIPALVWFG